MNILRVFMNKKYLILFWFFCISTFVKASNVDSLLLLVDSSVVSEKQIEYKLSIAKELCNYDINRAMLFAEDALENALKLNCWQCIAESNLAIGKYYNYMGLHSDAIDYLNRARTIFEQLNNDYKKTVTIKLIGDIYYYSEEYGMALQYYLELIEFAQTINDTSLIIDGLISKGKVYGNSAKMDSAIILFWQAYKLCQQVDEPTLEIQSLFYIGDVHLFSGKPKKALKVFHKIEKKYNVERDNIKVLATMYNSITKAYILLGDNNNARLYNKKALNTLTKFPRLWSMREYYEFSFQIDTMEKNYVSAISNLLKHKEYNDSINKLSFKKKLANFESLYELQKKENRINSLEGSNRLKDIEIRNKRLINYSFGVLILLSIILVYQVYLSRKKISNKNRELNDTVEKLKAAQQSLIQSEKMASLGTLTAELLMN